MASVAPHRRSATAPRRGSAFVSPVVSSNSDDSSGEDQQTEPPPRRQSRWSRDSSSSSESSDSESSSFSVDDGEVHDLEALMDAYEDFVGRRTSQRSQASSQSSVAKLDRLRRIFLNMPAKTQEKKLRQKDTTRPPRPQPIQKTTKGKSRSRSSVAGTSSNSSGDEKPGETSRVGPLTPPLTLTLPIDHHVKTLSEQVKLLARTHDAHAQQWHVMLTQAIAELQFVKQQEEHALQSHAQLLQESYALRLEVFEQQYRAKVAEIRDQLQQEIARHRQQSDLTIVSTAKRLQEQAQQVLLQTDGHNNQEELPTESPLIKDDATLTLVKTNQFLQRQQQREEARRSRQQPLAKTDAEPTAATHVVVLSPVSKQRAKLKMLEQKLALFPRDTVDRVTRTMETQARQRRSRGETSAVAAVLATAHDTQSPSGDDALRPTPLSPLRKRASYWHNGISKETPSESQKEADESRSSQVRPSSALSRRFLRPEEEKELRMLRNSIGLAKDWMEQNNSSSGSAPS